MDEVNVIRPGANYGWPIYISQTADLLAAQTLGDPAIQTEAPLRVARVAFDHDNNPRTPAMVYLVTNSKPTRN